MSIMLHARLNSVDASGDRLEVTITRVNPTTVRLADDGDSAMLWDLYGATDQHAFLQSISPYRAHFDGSQITLDLPASTPILDALSQWTSIMHANGHAMITALQAADRNRQQ